MSTIFRFAILAILLTCRSSAAPRDAQWKKVEEAINSGLPKTAIAELEPIIQSALRDKAYGEAVKAIGRKLVLEGNIQGNKPEEKITRLEAEIAKAPKQIVPLLETIQAHWYWQYFQNNRWRFMRRTTTGQAPGNDFTTWDLPRLFQEIDRHFQIALSAAPVLKKTPVTDFADVLEKGTMPESYRPTLYDFIAHEALNFYASGEQAAGRAQDAFEISADDPIFGTSEEFLDWKPQTTDTNSPFLKAIRLFQDLLRSHQFKADGDAFFHNDLERLIFARNVAYGENKNARFITALKRFPEGHEITAMAHHQWAQVIREEGDLVQARTIALQAWKAFPESPGGKLCHNLVKDIEAKAFNIITERVWNSGPAIQVRYRNLTNLYFRAIPYGWNLSKKQRYRTEYLNTEQRKNILAMPVALSWSAKLSATPDYKERTENVPAPNLKPGFYFIAASHDPNFGEQDNYVMFSDVWVSELALVLRPRNGVIEGFVLEAKSGDPVAGATVTAWHFDRNTIQVPSLPVITDDNGLFTFLAEQNLSYLFRVEHKGRELVSQNEYSAQQRANYEEHNQTIFFTDRALYRPGQIIQYKGICLRVNPDKDNYHTIARADVEVIFDDPNGKEIARQKHRCNDYGSFAGSFTAPASRLTGRMSLRVTSGPQGATSFSVEEYKRPKFQVTLEAPKEAAKLNDKVSISGKALAYTGAAIDNAAFKYRIVRQVQMPYWWGWFWVGRASSRAGQQQEIAHGTARTDNDGSFKVEFVARPDPSVPEKDEPVFAYMITVDVTDNAGETRSDTHQIQVGYTALRATVSIPEWQTEEKPVEISIHTETLDGIAQAAEGTVKIYRLKQPATVHRPGLFYHYYWDGEPPREPDLSNPNNWELGEVVFERGVTTDAEGKVKTEAKLPVGAYRAVFESQDRFGKKVTGFAPIQVLNPAADKLALKIPGLVAAPKWSLEPGEEFMALWGTGYDQGRAFIEIEHRNNMLQRFWTNPKITQVQIRQALNEAMRGGFTLHVTRIQENRAHLASRHVDVPWSNKNLDVKWEHFTSKLEPAQKETWTAVISGPDAHKAVAEMVATLYDASLDAFIKHYWQQRLSVFRQDYSTASPQFENLPKNFQWVFGGWDPGYVGVDIRFRHFPYDFVQNPQRYDYFLGRWGAGPGGGGGAWDYRARKAGLAEAPMSMAAESLAVDRINGSTGEVFLGAKVLADKDEKTKGGEGTPQSERGPDLAKVAARKNLNETAFFFPQLISDSDGKVKLQFTMPEALTEWRFLGFAHDKDL
ncbi:MAG TPA: MG2 domain-containing protein, partial [Verrucomicrobiae bacterium]|nr:MG2 domain-containing protein [Verrucomicrobiae bacterium]